MAPPGESGVRGWFEESSEDGELPAEGVLIGSDIAIGMGYVRSLLLEKILGSGAVCRGLKRGMIVCFFELQKAKKKKLGMRETRLSGNER